MPAAAFKSRLALICQKMRQPLTTRQAYFLIFGISSGVYFIDFLCYLYRHYLPIAGNLAHDHTVIGLDFSEFWMAARLLITQGAQAVYEPLVYANKMIAEFDDPGRVWAYPPTFLLIVWPLGILPYKAALIIWLGISLIVFVLANRPAHLNFLVCAALCLLIPNVSYSMFQGQNGLLTSALLIAAMHLNARKPYVAGMLFGAMIIKPQLALMVPIYLCATRNWRTMVASFASALCIICASIAAFGTNAWEAYFTQISTYASYLMGALFHRGMPTMYMFVLFITHHPMAAMVAQACCSVIILISSYYAFTATRNSGMHFMIVAAGMFLITPYTFVYDLPIVSIAVLYLLWHDNEPLRWQKVLLYGAVWFLPLIQLSLPIGALVLSLFYWHVYDMALRQEVTATEVVG